MLKTFTSFLFLQLPWIQAKAACEANGQKLVSVESPTKDDLLVQLFVEQRNNNGKQLSNNSVNTEDPINFNQQLFIFYCSLTVTLQGNSWISATEVREGVWHWDSLGKPLYHSRWFMDGQPDDTENLNCVYLASTAMLYWRDANCSASMYFICESRQGAEPTILRGYE